MWVVVDCIAATTSSPHDYELWGMQSYHPFSLNCFFLTSWMQCKGDNIIIMSAVKSLRVSCGRMHGCHSCHVINDFSRWGVKQIVAAWARSSNLGWTLFEFEKSYNQKLMFYCFDDNLSQWVLAGPLPQDGVSGKMFNCQMACLLRHAKKVPAVVISAISVDEFEAQCFVGGESLLRFRIINILVDIDGGKGRRRWGGWSWFGFPVWEKWTFFAARTTRVVRIHWRMCFASSYGCFVRYVMVVLLCFGCSVTFWLFCYVWLFCLKASWILKLRLIRYQVSYTIFVNKSPQRLDMITSRRRKARCIEMN